MDLEVVTPEQMSLHVPPNVQVSFKTKMLTIRLIKNVYINNSEIYFLYLDNSLKKSPEIKFKTANIYWGRLILVGLGYEKLY